MLGPLIILHELGHYLVGRWCGVDVQVFSIGFGREVIGWTDRSGTRWRLAGEQCWGIVRVMVSGVRQIVVGQRSVQELGGPVKIAQLSGEQLSLGLPAFVYFVAFISINLAFINLLPIPVLDGGHLAFYAAEALRGKPLGARSQEWAFRAGLAAVLGLMVFVTLNDRASFHIFGR